MSPEDREAEDLGPEEQAEYAELLAAYLTEPEGPPAAVAARLDEALAGLVVERQRQVPASLRAHAARRRRLGGALLAAAAVTVGGFAVGPLLSGGGSDESADTASTADAGGEAESDSGSGALLPVGATLPRVRQDHLEEDVVRLAARGLVATSAELGGSRAGLDEAPKDEQDEPEGQFSYDRRSQGCVLPVLEEGATFLVVEYAGRPVVLVADPEDAPAPRSAVLVPCAGGDPVAEVPLPAADEK